MFRQLLTNWDKPCWPCFVSILIRFMIRLPRSLRGLRPLPFRIRVSFVHLRLRSRGFRSRQTFWPILIGLLRLQSLSLLLQFLVSDVQAQSHLKRKRMTEIPFPGLSALGDEAFGGNPLKTKSFWNENSRWKLVSTASLFSLRLAAFSTALSVLLCRADEFGVSVDVRRAIADFY